MPFPIAPTPPPTPKPPTPVPTPAPTPTPTPDPKAACPVVGGSTDCCTHTASATDKCLSVSDFYDTAETRIMHADGLTICSDQYAPPQAGEKLTVCPN